MTATKTEIRRGTYYDSVVLMQLQVSLAQLSGVVDVGVMMGTAANKDLMAQSGLLTSAAEAAQTDDLLIVIQGEDEATADWALSQIDALLVRRRSPVDQQDYLPQSIEAAAKMLPEAGWVLISVPGRYAAGVAREALRQGKHVFLYSDNVSVDDEIELKQSAAKQQLLVMDWSRWRIGNRITTRNCPYSSIGWWPDPCPGHRRTRPVRGSGRHNRPSSS
jgi:FdrA protein